MSIHSYGVIHQNKVTNKNDLFHESFARKGFVVLPSKINNKAMRSIGDIFENVRECYSNKFFNNKKIDFSIRALFSFDKVFLAIAQNKNLLKFLSTLFDGEYILNQQNGIINSPHIKYNQARWHRDLPYQHFVTSKFIAINVIYCIDKFTVENGCTIALPYSQLFENFPSNEFITYNQEPIIANPGDFIILNGMTFHKGGVNNSSDDRRAINSVYTIPFIRHQVDVTSLDYKYRLNSKDKKFLGFQYSSSKSLEKLL